ncbi:hypothetical protein AMJ85_03160 [candidate division BRC1 bacterium SM23_51]|nr:MAG: hypothetical protein AMJ85_03160 [candidate division BRC1 bacterium SM23_51]
MALLSMTGFGKAATQNDLGMFGVEIRSVNNRYFDFNPRLPREWAAVEIHLRDLVHRHISRGKVNLSVHWVPPPDMTVQVHLSEQIIGEVAERFHKAGERRGVAIEVPWSEVFKLPGVLTIQPPDLDADALFAAIENPVVEALDQLDAMRAAEGRAMAKALASHLATVRQLTDDIERQRGCVLEKQRERLQRLVEQMRPEVGQALSDERLEAEVLLFADRSDITEEVVRLHSHCETFERLLAASEREPSGKRMEFIAQEILREANTIGSKARDTEIITAVIALKHETEKIREQLQNVE